MKTTAIQIVAMLQAYNRADVLLAIDLYKQDTELFKKLVTTGWKPQNMKPENKEYYHIDGKYWIQTEDVKQKNKKAIVAKNKYKQNKIKCPSCGNSYLSPVVADGLKILGCKKCRYSKIVK